MKKVMTIFCMVVTLLAVATSAEAVITKNYGDVTLNPSFEEGHFSDVWDLTQGDLTLTYTIDMTKVTQTSAGETPYTEVGLREVGAGDFNPGPFDTYQGGAGGWMTSLVGDLATNPANLDLDDKHNLSASGGRGEADYDVYALNPTTVLSPFGNHDTTGFWFDRDGVDPYQNTYAANTGGTYDITLVYRAVNASLGTMIATINGNGVDDVNQKFRIDGNYTGATGLSFLGDMTQMQVFAGAWWADGAGGDVDLSDLTVTGVVPEPATMALLGLGALLLRRKK